MIVCYLLMFGCLDCCNDLSIIAFSLLNVYCCLVVFWILCFVDVNAWFTFVCDYFIWVLLIGICLYLRFFDLMLLSSLCFEFDMFLWFYVIGFGFVHLFVLLFVFVGCLFWCFVVLFIGCSVLLMFCIRFDCSWDCFVLCLLFIGFFVRFCYVYILLFELLYIGYRFFDFDWWWMFWWTLFWLWLDICVLLHWFVFVGLVV